MTQRKLIRWLPFALLAGMLAVLFYPLLRGETLFWGLPSLQFYPWRHFAFAELRAGRLPAWNPYVGAGAPLLANYQTAVFYPPNWLWLVLPDLTAMNLIALGHVLWAGLGMWLFARALGLTDFGRGISALAFAFGGYLIARAGSFPTANAGAWMPWLFWLVHRAITRRQWRDIGWLGLACGLQLLAGHAQTTWYSGLGVGLYALWIAGQQAGWHARIAGLARAGAGALLGALIAAVQLVPTGELLLASDRSDGLDFATAANLSYSPLRLITLLSPHFYGTPADGSYLTQGIYFEDALYLGFIPFVSALAALAGWVRKRRHLDAYPAFRSVPLWGLLSLGALLIALGRYGPVFRPLYEHVPTFDAFREPVRWLILPAFGLAVLAGIGVQHWGRGKWLVFWMRLAAAGGAAAVIVALIARQTMDIASENLAVLTDGFIVLGCWVTVAALFTLIQPQPDQRWLARPGLWRVAVLLFVAVDLTWAADGLNPTVPRDFFAEDTTPVDITGRIYWFEDYTYDVTFGSDADEDKDEAGPEIAGYFDTADYRAARDDWRAVRASLLPNLNMLDHVPAFSNNDPLLVGYHAQYRALIEAQGRASTPLLQAAGVTRVYDYGDWPRLEPLFSPPQDYAFAWLVPAADWHTSATAIKDALRDPDWDPAHTVILAGAPPDSSRRDPLTSGAVNVQKSSPTEMQYRVTTDGAAFLVISNSWYPGWDAQIDGQPATLHRANLAFQAVAVPPGTSTITLRYAPAYWRWSTAASGTGVLLALALIVGGAWWPRRQGTG